MSKSRHMNLKSQWTHNSFIRTWSYFEQVETIKGKLEIADVEVQITIPTKKQIIWFELQFTFSILLFLLKQPNEAHYKVV